MEKNVTVIDEAGNSLGATYPKRARGLVKKGRARFVDESTICLACSPDNINYLEDNMDNMTYNADALQENDEVKTEGTSSEAVNGKAMVVNRILDRMDQVMNDDTFDKILLSIDQMTVQGPGDIGTQAKANVLNNALALRMEQNNRILDLCRRMLEELEQIPTVDVQSQDNNQMQLYRQIREDSFSVLQAVLEAINRSDADEDEKLEAIDNAHMLHEASLKEKMQILFN